MHKLFLKGFCLIGAIAAVACGGGGDIGDVGSASSSSSSGSSGQGGNGTGGGTNTGGASGTDCSVASDCDAKHGPAACGAWACNAGFCEAQSPGCTDADHDGFGSGAACMCAGLDCDDNDAQVGSSAPPQSCYSGPPGTEGVGTCQAGTRACAGGAWSPCAGEVTPSGEACNSMDEDCNGVVDDNLGMFTCGIGACQKSVSACTNGAVGVCSPGAPSSNTDGPMCNGVDDDCDGAIDENCAMCVPVSLNGDDMTADGTFNNPFKTIQAAINWTVANNGPPTVCVAAGQNCGTANNPVTGTYALAANTTITMADGISVLGNYAANNWSRCTGNTTTVLQPQTPEGVTFPNQVTKTTVLDGFRVDRVNAPTTAAITVDGAKNVILSNLAVSNTPAVMNSYGVNVINGGDAILTQSRVDAGQGSVESIGVRVVGATVHIQNNCLSLDAAGRCDDFCGGNPSIRGRIQTGSGLTHAVLLQNSPKSSIETSALCANDADIGSPIRISGDGNGILIRGNFVNAFGGAQHSHGIWMEDCAGAAPWIVDNHYIAAVGDTSNTLVDAIRAIGDCHPVIDSNREITGGGEGNTSNTNGVHCGANAMGVASKCVVLGNTNIRGSATQFPPSAVGVRCDNGGCMKIAENTITGRGGVISYGIFLEKTGALVDRNAVRGGCASQEAAGVYANDAYTRLQNNLILGFTATDCAAGNPPPMVSLSSGLKILTAAGNHEIDVHSNTIIGGGNGNAPCTSSAIVLGNAQAAPPSAVGIFRNNILRVGACMNNRIGFEELVAAADPRIFENNNLDSTGMPTAIYMDEAGKALISAMEVNALMDTSASNNQSANPLFVNPPADLHLMAGSPCAQTGTPSGAPLYDYDNKARDPAKPSIGAFEP